MVRITAEAGHVSRDSTAIEAREKPKKPEKKDDDKQSKKPRRLEQQPNRALPALLAELPKQCTVGRKRNAKGIIYLTVHCLGLRRAEARRFLPSILPLASVSDWPSPVALPPAGSSIRDSADSDWAWCRSAQTQRATRPSYP